MTQLSKSQAGIAHVLLAVAVVVLVGAVGYITYSRSSADTIAARTVVTPQCGMRVHNDGRVYASAVGTRAKFNSIHNSDSIRNIAIQLCGRGYLSRSTAVQLNKTGTTTKTLQNAYLKYEQQTAKSYGGNKDGVPGAKSLRYLGLTPYGF